MQAACRPTRIQEKARICFAFTTYIRLVTTCSHPATYVRVTAQTKHRAPYDAIFYTKTSPLRTLYLLFMAHGNLAGGLDD
jgi:hypothetical protein